MTQEKWKSGEVAVKGGRMESAEDLLARGERMVLLTGGRGEEGIGANL